MVLKWTPEFVLGIEAMDFTHREFLNQLNALGSIHDDKVMEKFTALIAHTKEHFHRENEWMLGLDYARAPAHVDEHEKVLNVMSAVSAYMEGGHYRMGRMVARELAQWFRHHALTMDAELAKFLLRDVEGSLRNLKKGKRAPKQRK